MNLESVFFITQIIAAIAVVASLFYVAYEVRHNTKALKISTYQSIVHNSMELLYHLYGSEDTASFYYRCVQHYNELNEVEKIRWHSLMLSVYRHWDNLLYQNEKGSLEKEMWLSYDRTMSHYLTFQPWVLWFESNYNLFSTHLQKHLMQKIKEIRSQ
ncbi:MAG: hypothetical protein ABIQ07_10890 [Ginsengibacter sp.]